MEVHTDTGVLRNTVEFPPGSPQRPPTPEELARKLVDCLANVRLDLADITWADGARLMREHLGSAVERGSVAP